MTTQLKIKLANALNIKPTEIRDVKPARDGGYNVVLTNYQKFRNVEPKEEEPEPLQVVPELPAAPPKDAYVIPGTEIYIPSDLQKAYTRPSRATVVDIKKLLDLLEVKRKSTLTKKQLVKLVNDWKLEHAP